MKLIDKAKSIKSTKNIKGDVTFEQIEVVIAWLDGEISWKQMTSVLPEITKTGVNYGRILTIIRNAHANKWIKITLEKENA